LLRRINLRIEQGTSKAAKLAMPGLPRVATMRHNAGSTACIDKDEWASMLW
jgi:hypothetical protein